MTSMNMDSPTKFFECSIPISMCNLECEYCYVRNAHRNFNVQTPLKYSRYQIEKCLTQQRLGGKCFFSFCGSGETTLYNEMPMISDAVVSNGHYMNITTNGTSTSSVKKILEQTKCHSSHLLFSCSLHYNELAKRNLLQHFIDTIECIKSYGASYIISFVLNAGYYDVLDKVKEFTISNFGHLPAVFIGRIIHSTTIDCNNDIETFFKHGKEFNSKLFYFCLRHFGNTSPRKCNAGKTSFVLNFQNGICKPCYHITKTAFNIFEDDKPLPIQEKCINCCRSCVNNAHFMALGSCPFEETMHTYYSIRKDHGQFSSDMKEFLSQKLPK